MSTQFHLCNISLVDGENLAGSGAAYTIGSASASFSKHWTGEEQVTTGSALAAATYPNRELLPDVILAEMNQ